MYTDGNAKTILFTSIENSASYSNENVEIIHVKKDRHIDLNLIFGELFSRNICSILVEGGNQLSTALIQGQYVDELVMLIAPKIYGQGLNSFSALDFNNDILHFNSQKTEIINDQMMFKGMISPCLQD